MGSYKIQENHLPSGKGYPLPIVSSLTQWNNCTFTDISHLPLSWQTIILNKFYGQGGSWAGRTYSFPAHIYWGRQVLMSAQQEVKQRTGVWLSGVKSQVVQGAGKQFFRWCQCPCRARVSLFFASLGQGLFCFSKMLVEWMKRLLRWCVIRKATVSSPVVYKYSISEKRHSPREQQNELAWKPSGTFPNSVERSQKPLAWAVNRDTWELMPFAIWKTKQQKLGDYNKNPSANNHWEH